MGSEKSDLVMRQKIYGGSVSVPRAVIDEMHRSCPDCVSYREKKSLASRV
jgi:hypothetical protein